MESVAVAMGLGGSFLVAWLLGRLALEAVVRRMAAGGTRRRFDN